MQKKQRVLVTGGTGALGAALVTALTEVRHEVVANYAQNEERAGRLGKRTGCQIFRADVSREEEVEALFERPFDTVFHLAGISRDALLLRLSPSNWEEQLRLNLQGAFLVTRAALRGLPEGGRLVLVSSRVGERGYLGQSAYGASKAGMLGLMKTAALEGSERGLKVNAVCPGFAASALSESLNKTVLNARARDNWLPDADAVESFVACCLFLLNSNVSGQILRPDCRI